MVYSKREGVFPNRIVNRPGRWLPFLAIIVMLLGSSPADAQRRSRRRRPAVRPGTVGTVILDTTGFWRLRYTLLRPAFRVGEAIETSKIGYDTALPPANWRSPDFDDSGWRRAPGQPLPPLKSSWAPNFTHNAGFLNTDMSSPSLALIAVRGKFKITNPARVRRLSLSVEYRGGVAIYINGKQLVRAHLPADGDMRTLADDYPIEAWLDAKGQPLTANRGEKDPENLRRWDLRTRKVENIPIPAAMLRRGVNVLAIEVHRSAYPKEAIDKITAANPRNWAARNWSTCGLRYARMTSSAASGIVPNVARPDGMQVWDSDQMQPDFDLDWGDPLEPLEPIRIVAARNGSFSGKVVVGDTRDIKALAASVSDLTSADGATIAAANVLVRYAALIGATSETGAASHYRASPGRFDALLGDPPAVVPVRRKKPDRACTALKRPGQPEERFGAVQPIWLTVHVPRDAAPGSYSGTLRISAAGRKTVSVPINVEVEDFTLPDPADYRTVVDLVHSPESVALQYGAKIWSDRHLALLAGSQKLLGRIGNWTMYVHLIAHSNMGNSQSIIRWTATAAGGYTPDFSAFDKYLDVVVRNMGKPKIVALYIWDYNVAKRKAVPVTSIRTPGGKAETIYLPMYDTPRGAAIWKPVADHIAKQLKAYGLDGAAMFGPIADSAPPKAVAANLEKVFGNNIKWMRQGHSMRRNIQGYPIGYQAVVWTPSWPNSPLAKSMMGWNRKDVVVQFMRSGVETPLTIPRLLGEMNIIGQQRGFGRIGADFWPVLVHADRRGRKSRKDLIGRYPDSSWRNLEWMTRFMLAPGPDGVVSTSRYEMMCEGIQECQARITVAKALLDGKISGDLAARARAVLADRLAATITAMDNHLNSGLMPLAGHSWWSTPGQVGYQWFIGSGWQDRSAELYAIAGEVSRAIGSESKENTGRK